MWHRRSSGPRTVPQGTVLGPLLLPIEGDRLCGTREAGDIERYLEVLFKVPCFSPLKWVVYVPQEKQGT